MKIWRKITIPLFLLILLILSYAAYRLFLAEMLPEVLREELSKYIAAIFLLLLGYNVQGLVAGVFAWYKVKVVEVTPTRLDDEFLPLILRLCKIGIWIIVSLLILPLFGINISALIAALGVGSLAIALAAQDSIANIISGFLLMIDRPFRVGDNIILPSGETVTVLDVGVRRSRFLNENQAVVILPNLDLSKSKIINLTYGEELKNQRSAGRG